MLSPAADKLNRMPLLHRAARLVLAGSLLGPPLGGEGAHAQPRPDSARRAAPRELKAEQAELEARFLRAPDPALYEPLGQLAERQGDPIAAADFYRRFLEDQPEAAATRKQLVERITQAQASAVEVAVKSPVSGAFLYLDGRLVGRFPLGRALLVRLGQHTFEHVQLGPGGQVQKTSHPLTVQTVPVELEFIPGRSPLERRPSVFLPVFEGQLRPGPAQDELFRTVLAGVRRHTQALDLAPERAEAAGLSAGCPADSACLLAFAGRLRLHGILRVETSPSLVISYFDVEAGTRSEHREVPCSGCSPQRLAEAARDAASDVVSRAVEREHGTLTVRTRPVGAELTLEGRGIEGLRPARTPATLSVLAGRVALGLRQRGYLPLRAQLDVPADPVRLVELTLEPNRAARRQRQVRIAKWTLLTAGLLGTAGGIVGLALHHHPALDRPIEGDVFGDRFRSLPQGAVFLSLGLAALGGTLALDRYERKLSKQAREDEAAALQRVEQY